jgi:hypothetical protein
MYVCEKSITKLEYMWIMQVAPFNELKFLDFCFYYNPSCRKVRVNVHSKLVKRIKDKLKALTLRSWGVSII